MFDEVKVPVVGEDNQFLSYTRPAKARILLKEGRAEVFCSSPFTIRLKGTTERKAKMFNPLMSFTKYFEEEKDVYVQNTSPNQMALEFRLGDNAIIPVILPPGKDPINLSQYVPFTAIKNCMDLRKLLTRSNPAPIRLLSEEEFMEYYQKKAAVKKSSVEEEVAAAFERQQRIQNRQEDVVPPGEEFKSIEEQREAVMSAPVDPQDIVTPKVVGLCAKVGSDVEESKRLPAAKFMEELELIEDRLTMADLEMLQSKGYYKTIKKWAAERAAKNAPSAESEE